MDPIDGQNQGVFSDQKVCASYLDLNNLFASESVIIDELKKVLQGNERILDIGIGTGRTTPFLHELTKNYVGVDYSANMISAAQKIFPSLDLRVVDARNLQEFQTGEFGVVFFSYNGIDYIAHADRLRVLSEIKRVLKPNGYFIFSTHNRNYRYYDKFRFPTSKNPLRFGWQLLKRAVSRLKNLKHHVYTDTYSIITDPGHYYRLLTYYISPQEQVRQLQVAGFATDQVKIYDSEGKLRSDSPQSAWLYYVVQR